MRKTTTNTAKVGHKTVAAKLADAPDVSVAKLEDENVVKDMPPANPFDEPIHDEYPDQAPVPVAVTTPAETVVEHPLSPTDANPNPHGNRDEPFVAVATKGKDGETVVSAPDKGSVEIEGTEDEPVHLGDGRTLGKGQREKVKPELLKDENLKGKFKRV